MAEQSSGVHQEQFPTDYILKKTHTRKVPWVAIVVVSLLVTAGGAAWLFL